MRCLLERLTDDACRDHEEQAEGHEDDPTAPRIPKGASNPDGAKKDAKVYACELKLSKSYHPYRALILRTIERDTQYQPEKIGYI